MDLIISGLDSSHQNDRSNDMWYRNIVKYLNKCKCNILSIDPPASGSFINSKYSIIPLLPLEMKTKQSGRFFLFDFCF